MRTVSSYGVELRKQNIPIRQTLDIYRSAVSCLIEIYAQAWDELAVITEPKKRFNTAEHLVHTTKKNQARFDFDLRFPKIPSYLRRAAIQHALGSVSSYKTRLELREKMDQKGGTPKLVCGNHAMPVFYRDVMYREDSGEKDGAYLKLYNGHDWKWFRVSLSHTDMEYLRKYWAGKRAAAPVLEKRHRKYFLRFSYTEEVPLTKVPVKEQIICSVDLGINTDAACTIMRSDGTVLGRKIAGAVTGYAEENHADVIVFEYLETKGKISGRKKQKLHLWRKRDIQKRCEHQAHRRGMRISRICAWNTSRLAYDGSGTVVRDPGNHSLCTFQNGKRYNCDLSASYNIGARYFIRELLKPLPATERSLLEAKVPSVKRRISCVYADLRELFSEMELLRAA
mgnify:FL=1